MDRAGKVTVDTLNEPRNLYREGATTFFASRTDQRFSYCLYVPDRQLGDPDRYPLIVVQHSTDRDAAEYRNSFARFCEEQRCILLAPLFPAGIEDPDDLHNYKFLEYRGIRFDLLLLDMIEEISGAFPVDGRRFLLHGFSGGGHFAHRFLYLHPERLLGCSIGAPGRITMLDPAQDWWLGTKGMAERFGKEIDLSQIRDVPIQLVIGGADVEMWEINDRSSRYWREGLEAQGTTRIERMRAYRENLRANGVPCRADVIPGIGHDGFPLIPAVEHFFREVLSDGFRAEPRLADPLIAVPA